MKFGCETERRGKDGSDGLCFFSVRVGIKREAVCTGNKLQK